MKYDRGAETTVPSDGRESPYIDAENERVVFPTSVDGPSQQRLSARASGVLRGATVGDDGTPKTWNAATREFQKYIMKSNAAATTWTDEKGVTPTSHRFTPRYAANKKGRICGGFRFICENAPPSFDVKTVLVTLEGWPYDDAGQPAPPVEYLAGLNSGRTAMFARIRRQFKTIERIHDYGYVTVREPHTGARQTSDETDSRRKGYPHTHVGMAVLTDADASNAVVKRPIRAALDERYLDAERGNPFAREEDHGSEAVTIRSRNEDGADIGERLAEELATNLIGYEFDFRACSDADTVFDVPDAVCRFAALLWATERRSVMLGGGVFGEWVNASQANYDPPSDATTEETATDGRDAATTVPRGGGGGPEMVEPSSVTVEYEFPNERDE